MVDLDRHEIMSAEMAPDVYDGPQCNQIRARWVGSAEGDMDGPEEVGTDGTIHFAARTFPPGTKVTVTVPVCPICKETPHDMGDLPDGNGGWFTKWQCGCAFDWREYTYDTYS